MLDRFDTSDITVMTELSRLISARSVSDPTMELLAQKKKLADQLQAKDNEIKRKNAEIEKLKEERKKFEIRH